MQIKNKLLTLHRDNRWGTFWSVSGAWRTIEEEFIEWLKSVKEKKVLFRLSILLHKTYDTSS